MQNALIIEDIDEVGNWLSNLLKQAFKDIQTTTASSCNTAKSKLQGARYNLVLLDISLPDGSGLDLIPNILNHSPETYIVITTIFDDDEHIMLALQRGACGYLLKDLSEDVFISKLRGIIKGDPPLSPSIARKILKSYSMTAVTNQSLQHTNISLSARETEVLILISKGLSRKEVANMLGLSTNTIARYIRDIYQKLNVSSRAEATLEACRMGLVNTDIK